MNLDTKTVIYIYISILYLRVSIRFTRVHLGSPLWVSSKGFTVNPYDPSCEPSKNLVIILFYAI